MDSVVRQADVAKYNKSVTDHDTLQEIFDRDIRKVNRQIRAMSIGLTAGYTIGRFIGGWLVCKIFFSRQ